MVDSEKPKDWNSDDRHTRAKHLNALARPHKNTPGSELHQKQLNRIWNTPEKRAQVKEMHQKAVATINAQFESGAGYPSDIALREFLMEYNNRLFQHGSTYMPTSFSIAEAFFVRRREFAGLCLLPEEDYLISFTDFLDYVTSPDAPSLDISHASSLRPNQIINVNSLDAPGALLLETNEGHSFSFLGASYVRRGDEISMLLIVGEQLPEEELQALQEFAATPSDVAPHKPDMAKLDDLKSNVVFIDSEKSLVRDVVLCRFNLKERRLEARCLLQDCGNRYTILTDIVETLFPHEDPDGWAHRMSDQLDKVSVVWETAKTLLLLPAYLNARITLQRVEQRTTKLGLQMKNSLKFRRSVAQALPEAKVVFRRISAIRVASPSSPQQITGRIYTPPMFQVQVSGFWRIYSDTNQSGHDEEGNPIQGKTWVRGHIRHKDKSATPGPKVVYIKSSLALARRKLEQYRAQWAQEVPAKQALPASKVASAPEEAQSDNEVLAGAYVYVLRCPAHGRDIYKVGYTDRDPEQRARELSSKTATPTPFLVVQAWAVSDGRIAEQAAHQALDTYRLDGNREFFQASYSTLRQSLEDAIQLWVI